MTLLALNFTLVFVLVTMCISIWQKLGLEKDIAIATIRAAVQLLAIGYVLQFVIHTKQYAYLVLIVLIMITVATLNAAQRGKGMRGIAWRIGLTIALMEAFMMLFLLGLRIIEPTAQYIIPLSGMTIGNAMLVGSLFTSHLRREIEASRGEIEALLSLGATAGQALQGVRKRAVKFSMIPTIDSLKTVGLVQLPGMMTGMIIAGASPIHAVRYQILILFAHAGSAAMTSMLLSLLYYRLIFTPDLRLRETVGHA